MSNKTNTLKAKLASIEIEEESLSLELQIWKYFKCGECDVDLANPGILKFHMKLFMKPEKQKLMKIKMKVYKIGRNIIV